jgi:sugar lactone lactonase YvrE
VKLLRLRAGVISFLAALATLSGCVAMQPSVPITPTGTRAAQPPAALCCPLVYVANDGNNDNSITVYAAGAAAENIKPIRRISGPKTGLSDPDGVAVDREGRVYVTNPGAERVTVYGAHANGNVSPIQIISGPETGLSVPGGIGVANNGEIYVANSYTLSGRQSVTVYAPGANGDVPPIRTIRGRRTGLDHPRGLALDKSSNLYVTNFFLKSTVTVYAPRANGNVEPTRIIAGSKTKLSVPTYLTVDTVGDTYVVNTNQPHGPLTVYAPGRNRDVKPIRVLRGKRTMLDFPTGIGTDTNRELYVASSYPYRNSINIYAPRANGQVAPVLMIAGSATRLDYPRGLAIYDGRRP